MSDGDNEAELGAPASRDGPIPEPSDGNEPEARPSNGTSGTEDETGPQPPPEEGRNGAEDDGGPRPVSEGGAATAPADDSGATALPPGIAYTVPDWSGAPEAKYTLEVLKNGAIIDTLDLSSRAAHVLGRQTSCHFTLEHPSLSRFHAVIQHRSRAEPRRGVGWYLFDLESTHGTFLNKVKVRPMEFHRLRVGYVIKFGGSSRLYILQGPESDREPETEMSYSQHVAERKRQRAHVEAVRAAREAARTEESRTGCSWGMGDDGAEEEAPEEVREMADELKYEETYIKDPKKALKAYFEREGYDQPEYEFLDAGFGKHHCRVELVPLQATASGRSTFAEALVSGGKKKEAVTACALEACRMLDRMGELHKAATSRAQRRMRDWEANEFYDSDEDTFLDRTGDIERKRARRMAQAGKWTDEAGGGAAAGQSAPKVDTFESLTAQFAALGEEIREVEAKLEQSKRQLSGGDRPPETELDALDAYMEGIKAGALDRRSRMALKMRLTEMRRRSDVLRRRLQAVAPNLSVLAMRTSAPSARNAAAGGTAPPKASAADAEAPDASAPAPAPAPAPGDARPAADKARKMGSTVKMGTGRMRFSLRAPALAPASVAALGQEDSAVEEEEEDDDEEVEAEAPGASCAPLHPAAGKADAEPRPSSLPARPSPLPQPQLSAGPPVPGEAVADADSTADAGTEVAQEERRRRRKRARPTPRRPAARSEEMSDEELPADPDYVNWLPPQGQTGDGRTALNERFGY